MAIADQYFSVSNDHIFKIAHESDRGFFAKNLEKLALKSNDIP